MNPMLLRNFLVLGLCILVAGCKQEGSDGANSAEPTDAPKEAVTYTPIQVDSSQLITLQPGLQVYVAKLGTGKKPQIGEEVIVHYHGYLPDGKVFDSSYLRESPINVRGIGTGQVIKGWDIAIPTLPVGSKAVLIIAPELGYGDRASGPIPPNSTLVFDVEVLDTHPLNP